ncbi:hypothetical protein BJX68DRAFT_268910 [Aspergillus pseudodeflectus]|uniref:Uncharacterized protein n=1 Tax=Aspergillus pseudodeflectus TaxID=176178 RepID=A0ABR4K159_9EURO
MPQIPPDDLWIAYGKRHVKLQTGKDEFLPWIVDHPAHWILALGPSDDRDHCTVYHVKGGPGNYKHAVEQVVSLNAEGFESIAKVGTIPVAQRAAFKKIVDTAIPRRCQDYVAHVLLLLARAKIIPMEVAEYHRRQVDKSVYAQLVDGPDPAVDVDPKDVEPVNAAEAFGKCEGFARKNKLGLLEYDACLQ